MELQQEFELFKKLEPQDYFRDKNLARYQEFQMNLELSYRLIENQEVYPDRTEKEKQEISVVFGRPEILTQEIKDNYRQWIVLAGFDELFKWIKEVMIDFLYLESLKTNSRPTTEGEFFTSRAKLMRMSIPELIAASRSLVGQLDEFNLYDLLNKIRNCLHHRDNILTPNLTDPNDFLDIKGNRFILYSQNETNKIELFESVPGLDNGNIALGQEPYTIRLYKLQKINFTLQEFSFIKDMGLILYLKLAENLFGPDNRTLFKIKMHYEIKNTNDKN